MALSSSGLPEMGNLWSMIYPSSCFSSTSVAKSLQFPQKKSFFHLFPPLHSHCTRSGLHYLLPEPLPDSLYILLTYAKLNCPGRIQESSNHKISLLRNLNYPSNAWQITPNLFSDLHYLVPVHLYSTLSHYFPFS